jgi:hypothetical protein
MATYGRINEFDEQTEDWGQYIERLGHYFVANEIDDNGKKRAIFLSVCGSKIYKLMCDLLSPAKPGDKTFAQLAEIVKNHLQPKPSEIVQRYKFHSCFRTSDQSVSTYVAHLRHLSADCNFGDTLEPMLRDRLVCGVNNDRIQRRLLAERELTFERALTIAQGMEQAEQSAADLQKNEKLGANSHSVNKVKHDKHSNYSKKQTPPLKECWRCGGKKHTPQECFFKDSECYICKKKGHLKKKCKEAQEGTSSKNKSSSRYKKKSKHLYLDGKEDNSSDNEYTFYRMNSNKREKPIVVNFLLNGISVPMEIDTGASKSVISRKTLTNIDGKMKPTHVKLRTYTGEEIPIVGETMIRVSSGNQTRDFTAIVVEGDGPDLVGRDWLQSIQLNWHSIFKTLESTDENDLIRDFEGIFDGERGTYQGIKAKIILKDGAQAKYFKARAVPYALKEKIGKELDKLETEGTIRKVQYSEWAAPIVPIVKEDGSIRICGDYKVTINPASQLDNYPIPKTEDLFANLKGKYFSKLDLSNAYQQIELDENSRQYTTINTHQGLYEYNRLCYGISSSPGIFQRVMDNIVQGLEGVRVRVDDILVAGNTVHEHNTRVREVFKRLQEAGMKLKKSKCIFMGKEVIYLGHKISESGVEPLKEKIQAVEEMERPTDKKELQSYLGLINYYSRFLQNISTVLAPMYLLLQKGEPFTWGKQQEESWIKSKKLLVESDLLVHYDQSKEVILTCDASQYGVGAVLSHKMEDGSERPIAFASRTLTKSEKNYSQIEKEGLAIIFGVKKFHQYLYANKQFCIITDHKPLLGLFKEGKGTSMMASARIVRWSLILSAYNYTLVHKPGSCIGHADSLSRFPLKTENKEPPVPGETILLMNFLETSPVTSKQIRQWTASDPVLSKVKTYILQGWPFDVDNDYKPYFNRQSELSVVSDCILWGTRVIVPPQGREMLLNELHDGHIGMSKMKALGRSYLWWPNMDKNIELKVKECHTCQINSKTETKGPLHSWDWPGRPWSRVHIDYAGPFMGKMFLVIIDAHSKWMDVYPTSTATSEATTELLRQSFATNGLPDVIVSDNGSCFTSDEFQKFMTLNGIKHITSAPYHPSTNGLAERAVQTFKNGMKKQGAGSIQTKVSRFLFHYRTTCQSTTGQTPAELLLNRKLKTRLDLIQPNLRERVERKQCQQQINHPCKSKSEFQEGDHVYVKNYGVQGDKWLKGHVIEKNGSVSFKVKLNGQNVVKRHIDQMKKCYENESSENEWEKNVPFHIDELEKQRDQVIIQDQETPKENTEMVTDQTQTVEKSARPIRERRRPVKLKDYV